MKLSIIIRFIVILLGIFSATMLAWRGLGLQPIFHEFFEVVERLMNVAVAPLEVHLVQPFVGWLRSLGLQLELLAHWKHAFVLLWLYNASFSRAVAPLGELYVGSGQDLFLVLRTFLRHLLAFIAALVGGVLAGTVQLDHPAVLWWPIAAFFFTWAGNFFLDAIFDRSFADAVRGVSVLTIPISFVLIAVGLVQLPKGVGHPAAFWWPVAAWFLFWGIAGFVAAAFHVSRDYLLRGFAGLAIALTFGLLAIGVIPAPEWLAFENVPSPGLANLVAFVAVIAGWYMLLAAMFPAKGEGSLLERWLRSAPTRTALDVFAVLGGAAFFVLAFQQ